MKDKVYVVVRGYMHEGYEIEKIFGTLRKAEDYLEKSLGNETYTKEQNLYKCDYMSYYEILELDLN